MTILLTWQWFNMSNCCVLYKEFPQNNRWCQYGLVTVSQYQLCVRWATCLLSFNVTGLYCKSVCGLVMCCQCVCAYHRTPAMSTIESDPLLGPWWVYDCVVVRARACECMYAKLSRCSLSICPSHQVVRQQKCTSFNLSPLGLLCCSLLLLL